MNSKYKTLFSNTVIFAIGNVLVKLIGFLLLPLYTTYLTSETYGIAELIAKSMYLIVPVGTLSIVDSLFRFSIDENADFKSLLSTALNVIIKGVIIISLIGFVLNLYTDYDYIFYFVLLYISSAFFSLFSQFSRGIGDSKRFVISGIVNAITLVFTNVLFIVILGYGAKGYLLSLIISFFVAAIYSFFSSRAYLYISIKNVDKSLLRLMLAFSLPNIPNMLAWWVNSLSSQYIINSYVGIAAAGLFAAAIKLPALINLFTTVFQQAWQYSTAKEINNNDKNEFFSQVFNYYSVFVIIFTSLLISITPYFSMLILRGEFYSAWTLVPLLLVSAALGAFSIFFGTFYNAVKKNVMGMVSTVSGAIVSLVISFVLIPSIGITGALIASVLSYLVVVIIRIIDIKRFVTLDINYKHLIVNFVLVLIQAIILSKEGDYKIIISFVISLIIILINFSIVKEAISYGFNFAKALIKK